mmetsp:Transcript_46226/g.122542  ORF Transcript_46226/g.122542 Transcript_46226/m.122542 type:complete len:335 (-) Transcript_46226:103-1107(-)
MLFSDVMHLTFFEVRLAFWRRFLSSLQSIDQFLTTLMYVLVRSVQSQILVLISTSVVSSGLGRIFGAILVTREERVSGDLIRIDPFGLILCEHLPDKILANWADALHCFQLLFLDVVVIPKGKSTLNHTVRRYTKSPNIDLLSIAPVIYFWRPENSCSHFVAESLIRANCAGSAKIAEDDVALLVCNIFPVHQIVVTLDIPVDDVLFMKMLDGSGHLLCDVDDVMPMKLSLFFHVQMKTINNILNVPVHDDADKVALVKNILAPHNVRMFQSLHHLRLPFDQHDRCFDFVNHLYSDLFSCLFVCTGVDDSKRSLSKGHTDCVLFQQLTDGGSVS